MPAGWTDVAAAELFAVIAAGRCPFTVTALLAWPIWLTGSARTGTAACFLKRGIGG